MCIFLLWERFDADFDHVIEVAMMVCLMWGLDLCLAVTTQEGMLGS